VPSRVPKIDKRLVLAPGEKRSRFVVGEMIDRQIDQENEESPSVKLAKLREAEIEKKKAEELEILKKPRPDLRTVEAEE